jgi:hypothetical protein
MVRKKNVPMDILEQNDQIQNESVTGKNNSGEIIEESTSPQIVIQDADSPGQGDIEESANPQVSETQILQTGEAKSESRTEHDANRDISIQEAGLADQERDEAKSERKTTQFPSEKDTDVSKDIAPQDEGSAELKDEKKGKEEFKVDYSALTREDLILRLEELLENKNILDIRTDVDNIKLNYYKKFKTEVEQLRKKFVEEGGDIDDFKAPEDPLESRIKELFKRYRELKTKSNRQLEQEKIENLEKKYAVIEKIKDLINSKESINKTFQDFRELQKEWRAIGLVPQQNLKDLWETYNHHVEKFYDYIKINKELKDLDFKKNLEAKIALCEKAEELLLESSIINAFKKLQKYHEQWREIGPVPVEMRTEIWERFRAATSQINKKHQQYYEELKKEQKKNLEQKRLLCEKAEDISNLILTNIKEWEEKSKELIEIQKVWRTIGFAPKKDNNKIYKRFRSACDQFFNRKREFYAQNKEMYQNNLQLKTDLCIQAEAIKDSSEWKKTTEDLINLQGRWKEIGPVPRKYSDQIWKRFRAACDYFFERKNSYYSSIDKAYEANLVKKEKLIKEIEKWKLSDDLVENFKILNDFQRRWTEIGFVPLKDKDAVQERYRVALNRHYDNLEIDDHKKNLLKFRNRVNNILQKPKSDLKLRQERDKFVARLQQLKNDIVLWENNIGFFTKSKNAQTMIDEVNNKISNARKTIRLLEAKIELIDNLEIDQG